MSKRGTAQVGSQMEMLPLEKWLAEERKRSNAMRPLGEVVAGVMNKVGQRRPEGAGGRDVPGQFRGGEEGTPRKETESKGTPTEAGASFARAANAGGGTFVDFLHSTMLRRHAGTDGLIAVIVVRECLDSAEHYACSGDEDGTWIPF